MKKLIAIIFASCFSFLSSFAQDTMRLTMYHAAKGKKTADGTVIRNPASQRICAMSPDMLKKYPLGTRVHVEGYGVYTVRDRTSGKYRRTIDLLISNEKKAISKPKVKVYRR